MFKIGKWPGSQPDDAAAVDAVKYNSVAPYEDKPRTTHSHWIKKAARDVMLFLAIVMGN